MLDFLVMVTANSWNDLVAVPNRSPSIGRFMRAAALRRCNSVRAASTKTRSMSSSLIWPDRLTMSFASFLLSALVHRRVVRSASVR